MLVVYNPTAKQAAVNTPSPRLQSGNLNLAGSAQATGAQGLLKAGEQLTGVMAKEYASYETTRVTQSLLEYQNALSTERSSYMEQNKGENAIGAGEHFAQFARETAYPLADQFSGRFRNMFLQNAVTYGLHFREQGEAYGAQQKTAWQKSQAESLLSQTLGNIANNPGDVEYVDRQATQIKALYAEMFPGLDRRAMETELTQKMAGAAIDGFLAKGNLGHAKESFNVYKEKGYLGAAATQYEARIRAEAKRMEAEARAQSQMNFLNAFASDPLKGIAEISTPEGQAKYGMDAKTAMGLRGMLQTQWSFNKQVEKEQRDNYTTQTINGIYGVLTGDPQKNVAPDPAKAYQLLQDSDLDAVTKIEMGRKLEEGTFGKVRDPGAVNDMARRIVSGEIASDAPIDVMLALGQASVGDVAALKAMRKDMEGPLKDYGKRWDSLVNNAYARSQFASGTPEAAIKEDRARSQGMKLIKEAYEKGGDEAVEKLFEESTLLTVLRNNATNLNDELEHMNTVIKAGSPQDSKLHRPGESGAEYLSRRLGKVPKQHPEGE